MKRFTLLFFALPLVCLLKAQTVTLDYYFNNEYKKNAAGEMTRFHYTWEDKANSGFSVLGEVFTRNGVKLQSLAEAPTKKNLEGTSIYIIVDPDTKKETADPHFINATDIKNISEWVKAGGVLMMMANDSANVELAHFNELAATFGIHFNDDILNKVTGTQFETGAFYPADGDPLFATARKIYLKELCSLTLSGNAKPLFRANGNTIIATTKYGKGTVLAVGDPWLYNEYCNGRLTPDFQNDKAADDLVKWLVAQVPKK